MRLNLKLIDECALEEEVLVLDGIRSTEWLLLTTLTLVWKGETAESEAERQEKNVEFGEERR